jgi:hypothetical protein
MVGKGFIISKERLVKFLLSMVANFCYQMFFLRTDETSLGLQIPNTKI